MIIKIVIEGLLAKWSSKNHMAVKKDRAVKKRHGGVKMENDKKHSSGYVFNTTPYVLFTLTRGAIVN